MDVGVEGVAIVHIGDHVVVVVEVAQVSIIVEVEILLPGVFHTDTIVHDVLDSIVVGVGFQAICSAVFVRVRVPLVDLSVAIIVRSVAALSFRGKGGTRGQTLRNA